MVQTFQSFMDGRVETYHGTERPPVRGAPGVRILQDHSQSVDDQTLEINRHNLVMNFCLPDV